MKGQTDTQTARLPDASTPDLIPVSELRPHEHNALLVPAMDDRSYRSFRGDIKRRGLLVPLEITAEKVVLDGVARLRAARELGLAAVPARVVEPDDEIEYILRAATERRHLTASQRAALAVELQQHQDARDAARKRQLANLTNQTVEEATLPPRGKTRDQAADWAGVSPRTVQDAQTVQNADPELFEQIRDGKIPANQAARRVRQRQRDEQLPPPAPMPSGPFDLVYADPPWQLPGKPDSSRAVENHYPTMPLEEIAAMEIPAADDAVLYLWAVPSLLPQALQVMEAWGFSYRGEQIWVKDKIGLGAWNRNQHEPLLVGIRGDFKPPETNRRFSSVIEAPRGRHSAKPEQVYELLERGYSRASKLELFRRGDARPGWTIWGNQAEPEEQA